MVSEAPLRQYQLTATHIVEAENEAQAFQIMLEDAAYFVKQAEIEEI